MRIRRGFSLIELMIGIAVAAILLSLAAPSFVATLQNSRATTQANELLSVFHLARLEALKRGRPVSLCGSANGTSCSDSWSDGWIVFVDGAAVGSETATVSTVLRAGTGSGATITSGDENDDDEDADADADQTIPLPDFVRFLPSGSIDPVKVTGIRTFVINAEGCAGNHARELEVAGTGRVVVKKVTC